MALSICSFGDINLSNIDRKPHRYQTTEENNLATAITGWADATNTGVQAGVTLTPYNGNLVINTPGAVISGLDIHGTVVINAPNVTLVNCKVTSSSFYVVQVASGVTGVTVQNCDIDGQSGGGQGIAGAGTFLNNDIRGCADGIGVGGDNTVIENNYIHDMKGTSGSHFDGIQADGGFSNLVIRHNTVINENIQTSAIMLDNYWGAIDNVTIDNNLLIGGGYTVYINEIASGQPGGGTVTDVSYTNNHIGGGYFGNLNLRMELGNTVVQSGNVNDGLTLKAILNTSANTGNDTGSPAPGAPTIASFSNDTGAAGDGITSDNTLEFKGTAAANSTIKIYDGSTQIGTATASSTGSWDYITSVLTNAKHVLTATATNSSGQTSAASGAVTVTVDTVAPTTPVLSSNSIVNTNQVKLSGTAEANSKVTVSDGNYGGRNGDDELDRGLEHHDECLVDRHSRADGQGCRCGRQRQHLVAVDYHCNQWEFACAGHGRADSPRREQQHHRQHQSGQAVRDRRGQQHGHGLRREYGGRNGDNELDRGLERHDERLVDRHSRADGQGCGRGRQCERRVAVDQQRDQRGVATRQSS